MNRQQIHWDLATLANDVVFRVRDEMVGDMTIRSESDDFGIEAYLTAANPTLVTFSVYAFDQEVSLDGFALVFINFNNPGQAVASSASGGTEILLSHLVEQTDSEDEQTCRLWQSVACLPAETYCLDVSMEKLAQPQRLRMFYDCRHLEAKIILIEGGDWEDQVSYEGSVSRDTLRDPRQLRGRSYDP